MDTVIRLVTPADAPALRDIYAPSVTDTAVSFELEPPTIVEMANRVESCLQMHPWLAADCGGELLGYVYASPHRTRAAYCWSVDVSVYIAAAHRRKGLGKALYTSLFACLRLQGLYNAYAGITLPNNGSVGLHESMGFEPVGIYREVGYKFGQWHDVVWLQMELQTRTTDPAPPILLPDAVRMNAWEAALNAGVPLLGRSNA